MIVKDQNPNPWATREVPKVLCVKQSSFFQTLFPFFSNMTLQVQLFSLFFMLSLDFGLYVYGSLFYDFYNFFGGVGGGEKAKFKKKSFSNVC